MSSAADRYSTSTSNLLFEYSGVFARHDVSLVATAPGHGGCFCLQAVRQNWDFCNTIETIN
jgi:hypothetical protein